MKRIVVEYAKLKIRELVSGDVDGDCGVGYARCGILGGGANLVVELCSCLYVSIRGKNKVIYSRLSS
jgi:hypothetical protein